MTKRPRSNLLLGLGVLIFAALLLGVWIPADVQTGLIEKVRRQVTIGDALAPTVSAIFLIISGALLVLTERNTEGQPAPSLRDLGFSALLLSVIVAGLLVMRLAGPAAVALVNLQQGTELEYRLLRDDAPWKYIGYLLGGSGMIAGVISLVEGRLRPRTLLIAGVAVVVMAAIYDLPFDDLLLPPNGDV